MSQYKILCYRNQFQHYKQTTSPKTARIPASDDDEFALVVCVSKKGNIGFDSSSESAVLLSTLTINSYILTENHSDNQLVYVSEAIPAATRPYTFKPKGDSFRKIIDEYEKSELYAKKFRVFSRHGRPCPAPEPTVLSDFLKESKHPISPELYAKLVTSCHYVTLGVGSGEHGHGAFEVFGPNLDVFFDDLKGLMGDAGELVFVEHRMIPYD